MSLRLSLTGLGHMALQHCLREFLHHTLRWWRRSLNRLRMFVHSGVFDLRTMTCDIFSDCSSQAFDAFRGRESDVTQFQDLNHWVAQSLISSVLYM